MAFAAIDPVRHVARPLVVFLVALALAACTTAQELRPISPPVSTKYAALVIDAASGKTLYEANSTSARFPASLTRSVR